MGLISLGEDVADVAVERVLSVTSRDNDDAESAM